MTTFEIKEGNIDADGVFTIPDELIKGNYNSVNVSSLAVRKLKTIKGRFPESVTKLSLSECYKLTIEDASIFPDKLEYLDLFLCPKIQNNLSEELKLKLEDLIKKGCKIFPKDFLKIEKIATETKTSRLQAVPASNSSKTTETASATAASEAPFRIEKQHIFIIEKQHIDANGVFTIPDELIKGNYNSVDVSFLVARKLKTIEGRFPESVIKLNLLGCCNLTIEDASIFPDKLKHLDLILCSKIQNNLSEELKLKLEDLIKKGCKIYPEDFLKTAKSAAVASKFSEANSEQESETLEIEITDNDIDANGVFTVPDKFDYYKVRCNSGKLKRIAGKFPESVKEIVCLKFSQCDSNFFPEKLETLHFNDNECQNISPETIGIIKSLKVKELAIYTNNIKVFDASILPENLEKLELHIFDCEYIKNFSKLITSLYNCKDEYVYLSCKTDTSLRRYMQQKLITRFDAFKRKSFLTFEDKELYNIFRNFVNHKKIKTPETDHKILERTIKEILENDDALELDAIELISAMEGEILFKKDIAHKIIYGVLSYLSRDNKNDEFLSEDAYKNFSNALYSALSESTEEQKSKISSNTFIIEALRISYLNAINTKDKTQIDFFSELLLKAKFLSGEEAKKRARQQIEMILNTKFEDVNQDMEYFMRTRLTTSDAENFLKKYRQELLKQIKLAITNPKIYLPALRQLDLAMRSELEKNGKLAEYEEYSRQASDKKEYCAIGDMNFVLNPNRFEHWNKNLRKVISEKLAKHGLTLINKDGEYVTFYGFVDNEIVGNIVKSGTIFTDNQVSQPTLLAHGKFTHAIQMYMLACAIENGNINLPDGVLLKDIISDIVDSKLWDEMFDLTNVSLDESRGNGHYYRFDLFNVLQSSLMLLGEIDPNLSCLSNYLSDTFFRNILKMIRQVGIELSLEQIILFEVCSENNFVYIKFLESTEYYAGKERVVKNEGGVVTKKMPQNQSQQGESAEPSHSPTKASSDVVATTPSLFYTCNFL